VVVDHPTIGLDEAARFLHMAPSTLRKRAAAGKLNAYKPGKTWEVLDSAPNVPMYRPPVGEPRWLTRAEFAGLERELPEHLKAGARCDWHH
jgi:hypothetical protein